MMAVQFHKFGGAEVLKLEEVPDPVPSASEVLVRVRACALNPVDYKIREGLLEAVFPTVFPRIPGGDVAGEILETGHEVKEFRKGERVFFAAPLDRNGGYAGKITVDARHVVKIPDSMGFQEAASLPVVALTAIQCLRDFGELKPGQKVLIHAGAGGLGTFAIQYARHLGARVFTTGRKENHTYLSSLGADVIIDYQKEDFVEVCQKAGGMDVVLESLGGLSYPRSILATKKGGKVPCVVNPPDSDTEALATKHNIKTGFLLLSSSQKDLELAGYLVVQGKVLPQISQVISLSEVPGSHQLLESGRTRGKIVVDLEKSPDKTPHNN